jgi:site-specific DNA-methyltransferase (adenine-specific)
MDVPRQLRQFLPSIDPHLFIRGSAPRVLAELPDASVDAFVTDPPYGIELRLGTRAADRNSIVGDGRLAARRLWRATVPQMFRVAKPDAAHLVFGTYRSPWMFDLLSRRFRVAGCVVWDKRIIGLGHLLRPRWEMIYLCVKGRPPRRGTAPAHVWEQARLIKTRHPCEKPVPMLRRAVRLTTAPGGLVCDPFAGIASTGVASLEEGCRFLGVEIGRRHWQLGQARLVKKCQPAWGRILTVVGRAFRALRAFPFAAADRASTRRKPSIEPPSQADGKARPSGFARVFRLAVAPVRFRPPRPDLP